MGRTKHEKKRPRVFAVASEKGGVGKTTLALHLAVGLAHYGRRVLAVDADPTANLTTGLGIRVNSAAGQPYLYDYLLGAKEIPDVAVHTENISLIPSCRALAGASSTLQNLGPNQLAVAFESSPSLADYDYIVIDSPPTLEIFTRLALYAADSVLGALQSDFYALDGIRSLDDTMAKVRQYARKTVNFSGIVLTRHSKRKHLYTSIEDMTSSEYGKVLFRTFVREDTNIGKASSYGQSVYQFAPSCRAAKDFRAVTEEFLQRMEGGKKS